MKTLNELVDELREPKYENLIRLLQNVEKLTNKSNITDIIDELDEIAKPDKVLQLEFTDSLVRPHESGLYVCITKFGDVMTCPYSKLHDIFNAYDTQTKEEANYYSLNDIVTMWAKPPESISKERRNNYENDI